MQKPTRRATKRSYEDGCAGAHALDLVGERWALLVVRELLLGPKRFTDLRVGLPGISPNVLTERLDELESVAIVRRRKLPPPAGAWVYELTDWGKELEPAIVTLGRWAARSPYLLKGAPLSVNSLVLSFRTMFDARAAAGLTTSFELRLGEDHFHGAIARGKLTIERGHAIAPDAVIETDPNTLAALVYGGRKLSEAVSSGHVRIDGDKSVVKRLLTSFPLPAPAARAVTTSL